MVVFENAKHRITFCASFYLSLSSPPGDESVTGSIDGLSLKFSIILYFLNIFCKSH